MRRRLLSCLPAVVASIVAWAVLGSGQAEVQFARVLGGPTRAGAISHVLVGTFSSGQERTRAPVPGLGVRLMAGSRELAAGVTGASGHLELALVLPPSPAVPHLRVERASDGLVLAEGELGLDVERWRAGARREGGRLPGRPSGELGLELSIVDGVLAVPFEGRLEVRVRDGLGEGARPLAGATLELELTGAELTRGAPPASEAAGVELWLRPLEHAVSARLVARAGARRGEWYGALPVLPGALSARLEGGALHVKSPIPREHAFVSFVSPSERLGGAVVPLTEQPDGTASGRFEPSAPLLARLLSEPVWAVVSSEDDKRSPAAVGWPLRAALAASPATTLWVADHVLLDGQASALGEAAARQRARRRGASGLLAVLGALTGGLFWLEVRRRGPQAAALGARREGWFLAAAFASIALGLGALAYFGAIGR